MTAFFRTLFSRYPIKTKRALELLPGFVSWALITFPLWGSFLIPYALAYFILFFDVYWLYKSFSLAIFSFIASNKIRKSEKTNWLAKAAALTHFNEVNHVIIIPNYQERLEKLRETLSSIAAQTFPRKRIHIVLAMEKREVGAKRKAQQLIKEFSSKFGSISATFHPDIVG
ncbi:MAG: hypothetical protein ACREGI_03255, partial [Candidatus Levyibacteriota bacterium]